MKEDRVYPLIQRYVGVKLETVWAVVEDALPDFRAAIVRMLEG